MTLDNLRDWVGKTQTVEDFAAPLPGAGAHRHLRRERPRAPKGRSAAAALALALFPRCRAAVQDRPGRPCRARRFPAADAAAAAHVGGQPLRLRRRAAAHRRDRPGGSRGSSRSNPRAARPDRWCSSRSSTPCRARAAPRSSRSTTSSIARPPSPARQQREPKPAPADATWSKKIVPDPVLLFRFSALTFNGHRIHYDQPYVTGTEGYPGLIVHGPLLGLLQIELARRSNPGKFAGELRVPRAVAGLCRRAFTVPRAARPTAPSRPGSPTPRAVLRSRERPPSDEPV